MKYTKGEWKRSIAPPVGAYDIATYSEGLSTTIARVHPHPEGLANANLIASAPELYEELKQTDRVVCHLCKQLNPQHKDCTTCADREVRLQILAKAEGKDKGGKG